MDEEPPKKPFAQRMRERRGECPERREIGDPSLVSLEEFREALGIRITEIRGKTQTLAQSIENSMFAPVPEHDDTVEVFVGLVDLLKKDTGD